MELTVEQLQKAFRQHDYILLRFPNGKAFAVNTKAGTLALKLKGKVDPKARVIYTSWQAVSFQEYISRKSKFVES